MEEFRKHLSNIPTLYFLILMMTLNVLLVLMAYMSYQGKILFWEYPFSYLGEKYTYAENSTNTISSFLYSLSMFSSSLIMLILAFRNKIKQLNENGLIKFTLYIVIGAGFLIAAFSPNDTAHDFHVLGSALFVAALWLLTTFELYTVRSSIGQLRHLAFQFFLQIPIFIYAFAYFWELTPFDSIMQKLAIVNLSIILIYSVAKSTSGIQKTKS